MASNSDRLSQFKNRGKDLETNRNRRKEDVVELRKARKEEQLSKRRNIHLNDEDTSDLEEYDNNNPASPLHNGQQSLLNQDIEKMVQGLTSTDPEEVMRCTFASRRVLSKERNPPIEKFIALNAVPRFVELLLRDDKPKLQLEAAWALTNIASGTSEQTKCVVAAGACPHFLRLLSSPDRNVAEQAVWALANIAGEGSEYRDMLIKLGIVAPLTQLVTPNADASFLANAAWCLSNLCRNKNPLPNIDAIRGCLPSIKQLLMHTSNSVVSDACWSLSYISDGSDDRIQMVIDLGVIGRLISIIATSNNRHVVVPAVRTLGNIVTGSDVQTQTAIDHGVLPAFKHLLQNDALNLRKEVTWAISNITAGNTNQIQAVISAGLLPHLVDLVKNGDSKVQKEAAWAISNFTCGGSDEQIALLVSEGCLPPLVFMLNHQDSKITTVILDAIKNILAAAENINQKDALVTHLEEVGLLDHLERLQMHGNEEIYNMSLKLIEDYWGTEDDDTDVQVSSTSDGREFAFEANQNGGNGPTNFTF